MIQDPDSVCLVWDTVWLNTGQHRGSSQAQGIKCRSLHQQEASSCYQLALLVVKKSDWGVLNVKVAPITFQVFFKGLPHFFPKMEICEINPTGLGNIPHSVSDDFKVAGIRNKCNMSFTS